MTDSSEYERDGQFYDPLELAPLLRGYGDSAEHWAWVEAIVEDIAATVGRYGFAVEEPSHLRQIIKKLRSPAETTSPSDSQLGGEYAQPMQGFPPTVEG